jgi:glycogenin
LLGLMDPNYAFVVLISSNSYVPGAIAVAGALKDLHPSPPISPEVEFETVCLVIPQIISGSNIVRLRKAFDQVIDVDPVESNGSSEFYRVTHTHSCCLESDNLSV